MEKIYSSPTLEYRHFQIVDILTTSVGNADTLVGDDLIAEWGEGQ